MQARPSGLKTSCIVLEAPWNEGGQPTPQPQPSRGASREASADIIRTSASEDREGARTVLASIFNCENDLSS